MAAAFGRAAVAYVEALAFEPAVAEGAYIPARIRFAVFAARAPGTAPEAEAPRPDGPAVEAPSTDSPPTPPVGGDAEAADDLEVDGAAVE